MAEWQPIETAPRDGTDILVVWNAGGIQMVVGWDEDAEATINGRWAWATLDGPNYHENAFSHWMPLPEPPPVVEEVER